MLSMIKSLQDPQLTVLCFVFLGLSYVAIFRNILISSMNMSSPPKPYFQNVVGITCDSGDTAKVVDHLILYLVKIFKKSFLDFWYGRSRVTSGQNVLLSNIQNHITEWIGHSSDLF